jgi:hypothetical protein
MTRARIYSQSGVGGGNVVGTSNVTLAILSPFLTTSNVTELANLYFTNARVFANLQLASIDDLRDVNVSVKSNAQALLWNSSTNVWYAGNVATSVTISTLSPFLTTANVAESNSNLYYTNARARTALTAADPTIIIDYATGTIRANIAAVSNVANTTDSISEGFTNQYFTNARVNAFVQPWLTSANVRELGNSLYFTNARVVTALNFANLVDLGDVVYSGTPSNNQVLTWNSTAGYWTNATANAGSAAASAGFAETSNVANTVLTLSNFTTYDLAPDPNGVNPYFSNARVLALFSPGGNTQITTSNVVEGANLYFTNARAQAAVTLSAVTPYLTTANVRETSNLYYTNARVLSYIGTLSTSNLAEGSNLYFTNARVNAFVQPYLTTANVIESAANLYFTNARVYANIAPLLTTANIREVTNLYYTNTRVNAYVQPFLTTANILESNTTLYYTNARVLANIAASNISTQFLTVTGNIYATDNVTTSKNLILAKNASAASANGLGIYIDGANASILYNDNTKSIDVNKNFIVTGNILPSISGVYNLGSPDKKFLSLYLGTQTLYIGNVSLGESAKGGLDIKTPSGLPSDASFANITATEFITVSRYANVTTRVEANGYFGGNVAEFINNKTGNIYYGIKKNDNWNSFAGMRVSETRIIPEPVYVTYTWYVANSFSTDYVLSGYSSGSDIPLTVTAGDTLVFVVNAPTHDLWIKTASTTGTGQGVTTGIVTNNGKDIGNVTWNTTGVVPGTYYYHSANDVSMGSTITVLADTYALGNVRSDLVFFNDNELTNNSVARLSILGDGNTSFYGNIYQDTGSKIYSNLVGNVTGYVSLITNHTTANLAESNSNLYYTNSRVRSTISSSTGVTYDSGTGVISIGQDVGTNANVTFRRVTITDNLTVYGNVTTVNSNNLIISDNMIYLNSNTAYSNPDIGFAFNYNDGAYRHGGFFRDHNDGKFKVFDNYSPEPDANIFIDQSNSSFRLANIQATTFFGNTEGRVTATTLTATTLSTGNATVSGILTANANVGLTLGTPAQGSLTSNAVTLSTGTTVTDSITLMNQVLGKLVPPSPPILSTTTGNLTILNASSYRICNFTQTINGVLASQVAAGTTLANVLRTNTWTTSWANTVGPGDSGVVTVYVNGVASGTRTLTTGSDNGVYGNLVISRNQDYNAVVPTVTAGFWESMDLRANSTVSPAGWNEVYITHSLGSSSNVVIWYNDQSNPGQPNATSTTFGPTTNSYTYSSNVPHFNSSTVWTLATNVNKLSGDFYYSSDTFITGASGTGFQTPASITYTAAGITTPLARNLYATSGNIRVTTTSSVATGFGRATTGVGPTLTVNNGYTANSAVIIPYTGNVLYKTGTASTMEETAITVGSTVGTGATAVARIVNPGNGDNPAYAPSATLYTSTSALQTYDAAIVGAVLRNDTTNYSAGHWPNFGPDLSGQATSQYFTFRLVRTSLSKFDIKYTGNIAGLWVAVPGSTIDSTSTANGWLDMSIAYGGSGVPGANVSAGGNGSQGCALGGTITKNVQASAGSYTASFGTVSTSSTGTNEVYVRIKLTTGQSVSALSLETASH